MNRSFITTVLACAVAAAPCSAATILPGIGGGVQTGTGTSVPAVTVQLYQDDGDGMFDPSVDVQVGPDVLTDGNGAYAFDSLAYDANYFVQIPAQDILGASQPADVSTLLSPGQLQLVIDQFDNRQSVKADPNTPTGASVLADSMSTVLGGERDLYVTLAAGIGEVSLRSMAFGVEVLQYDTTSGVMGHGIVTWDGIDLSGSPTPSLGLGNADLTQGGATGLLLKLGVDLTGTAEELKFRLFRDSTDEFSEASLVMPSTGGIASEVAFLPFDDFEGPVTPDDVNAVQMFLGDGSKSIDAQIDWIGTAAPETADFVVVPEPASVGLAAIGVLLLGPLVRRRQLS